jgi:hypothetical protein
VGLLQVTLNYPPADNLSVAYSLSETKTVAAKLGITTAALNTGFKAARKARATAKDRCSGRRRIDHGGRH